MSCQDRLSKYVSRPTGELEVCIAKTGEVERPAKSSKKKAPRLTVQLLGGFDGVDTSNGRKHPSSAVAR